MKIRVEVRLMSTLNGADGDVSVTRTDAGCTLGRFLYDKGIGADSVISVLLNGRAAEAGRVLNDNDVVAVFPK